MRKKHVHAFSSEYVRPAYVHEPESGSSKVSPGAEPKVPYVVRLNINSCLISIVFMRPLRHSLLDLLLDFEHFFLICKQFSHWPVVIVDKKLCVVAGFQGALAPT